MTNSIEIYQSDDGQLELKVALDHDTVWLTQAQLAELFQVKPQNITMHLKNILAGGELQEDATCKDFLQVQSEGGQRGQAKSQVLQSGCHYFSRLPGELFPRHSVPYLGHPHPETALGRGLHLKPAPLTRARH